MRKMIIALLILSILSCSFAVAEDLRDSASQRLTGYVDPNISLTAENIVYYDLNNEYGINLDVLDSSNSGSNLISPTATPLTHSGLKVGLFSVVSSVTNYKVVITHSPLVRQTSPEDLTTAYIDYELGVIYTTDGVNYSEEFCLSVQDANLPNQPGNLSKKIEIPLQVSSGVVMIQDAGIYFRLTNSSPVSVPGNYLSNITFSVESIT